MQLRTTQKNKCQQTRTSALHGGRGKSDVDKSSTGAGADTQVSCCTKSSHLPIQQFLISSLRTRTTLTASVSITLDLGALTKTGLEANPIYAP